MSVDLTGEVAIVTGASSGIGKVLCHQLAQAGVHLVLSSRSQDKLTALAAELKAKNPTVQVVVASGDVADPSVAKAVTDLAMATYDRIDVLVNNAGIAGKIALLQEIPAEEIHRTIDTNLKGPIFMMQEVLSRAMVPQQRGTIININSVAGKTAFPFWSIYDASKFGLRAITEAVAEEQRMNGIKVVGIHPGAVDTPIWNTIDVDHEPNREGMLDAETVAESVLYVLRQPQKAHISDITLSPLQPAL